MSSKAKEAFRTISEVADWLDVQTHVLRFWESKFTQVKPVKRAGGRRYYRPADMTLLGGIKKLLHDDGMTIKGAQKILKEQGVAAVQAMSAPLDDDLGAVPAAPAAAKTAPASTSETPLARQSTPPATQSDMFGEAPTPDDVIEDTAPPVETPAPQSTPSDFDAPQETEITALDASDDSGDPEPEDIPVDNSEPVADVTQTAEPAAKIHISLGGDVVFVSSPAHTEKTLRETLAAAGHASLGLRQATQQIYPSGAESEVSRRLKDLFDPEQRFPDLSDFTSV